MSGEELGRGRVCGGRVEVGWCGRVGRGKGCGGVSRGAGNRFEGAVSADRIGDACKQGGYSERAGNQ